MSKITVLGLESERKAMLGSLMDIGAIEISAADPEEYEELAQNPNIQDELTDIGNDLSDVRSALSILGKYCPEKGRFLQSRREITVSEFNKHLDNKDLIWNSADSIRHLEEQIIQLTTEENKSKNLATSLKPWSASDMPLQTKGTEKTEFVMGTIPVTFDWDFVERDICGKAPLVMERVGRDSDQYYVNVVYYRGMEEECLSALKAFGFSRVVFAGLEGTAAQNIEAQRDRLIKISEEKEKSVERIKSQERARASIEILSDFLLMEQSRVRVMNRLLKTDKIFMIKGWIPEKLSKSAKEFIESRYTASVELQKPGEDEEFPVLLENNGFSGSVEPVTVMYSLPNSREIDPDTVMAPFFILFFGLMLSDGGYGLVMALLSGLALWKLRLDASMRKFARLMFFCGLSTVFWGAMFGGWFGISFFTKYAIWFDATKDPQLMLSWSLLFGIVHLYAGLGMKAANMIRRKQYLDALMDVGTWYVTFTGFALFLLPFVPKVDKAQVEPLVELGKYLLAAGAILLILTQGRKSKKMFGKLFGGVAKLYDIISFLSDVLSYSRLMALGIATSIIASIVNQMAFMFDFPGLMKPIAAALILLVGHTVNFAINSLGAYVHSCRLQFLEFFGKFYEGGGESFEPLRAETQYIIVKQDKVA